MEQLRYILFVLALTSSVSLWAQQPSSNRHSSPLYYGISGGLVSNILVGSEIDLQKKIYNNVMSHKTGPTFSLFIKREITARWFIKYELDYIRKGNNSNNAGYELNTEYLSIPLKFGFQPLNFLNTKKIQASMEFGPALNFEPGHGTDNLKKAYSAANNSKVNKVGLGVLAGANFEYRLDPRRIVFLNYTFYHDLTPLLSYNAGNVNYKASNQGWMLSIGLMFIIH
ncbi:MAG: outer membrane beta-barrel protein [Bacteroidota bacterium]